MLARAFPSGVLGPGAVIKCLSVGWLIHDGEDMKALAPHMGDLGNEYSAQASGVIRIPARCITKVVKLDKPGVTYPVCPSSHPETAQTLPAS